MELSGIIIDGVAIIIVLMCIFYGYKKGLLRVTTACLAFILSIAITLVIYKPVANEIMNRTQLDEKTQEAILSKIQEDIEDEEDDSFEVYINTFVKDAKNKSSEFIAESLTQTIVEGITFIGLFLVLRVAFFLLNIALGFVTKLPIIKQFDKTGGIVYGVLLGIVIMYLASAIIYFAIPMIDDNTEIINSIDKTKVVKFFYEDNIIIKYISR